MAILDRWPLLRVATKRGTTVLYSKHKMEQMKYTRTYLCVLHKDNCHNHCPKYVSLTTVSRESEQGPAPQIYHSTSCPMYKEQQEEEEEEEEEIDTIGNPQGLPDVTTPKRKMKRSDSVCSCGALAMSPSPPKFSPILPTTEIEGSSEEPSLELTTHLSEEEEGYKEEAENGDTSGFVDDLDACGDSGFGFKATPALLNRLISLDKDDKGEYSLQRKDSVERGARSHSDRDSKVSSSDHSSKLALLEGSLSTSLDTTDGRPSVSLNNGAATDSRSTTSTSGDAKRPPSVSAAAEGRPSSTYSQPANLIPTHTGHFTTADKHSTRTLQDSSEASLSVGDSKDSASQSNMSRSFDTDLDNEVFHADNSISEAGSSSQQVSQTVTHSMNIGNIKYFQYGDLQVSTGVTDKEAVPDSSRLTPIPSPTQPHSGSPKDSGSGSPRPPSSPQQGIISRTIGSVTSLGGSIADSLSSFPGSPKISSFVDFSSGIFGGKGHDHPSETQADTRVDLGKPTEPLPTRSAGDKLHTNTGEDGKSETAENSNVVLRDKQLDAVELRSDLTNSVGRRSSGGSSKTHSLRDIEVEVENLVKMDDKPELFKSLEGKRLLSVRSVCMHGFCEKRLSHIGI